MRNFSKYTTCHHLLYPLFFLSLFLSWRQCIASFSLFSLTLFFIRYPCYRASRHGEENERRSLLVLRSWDETYPVYIVYFSEFCCARPSFKTAALQSHMKRYAEIDALCCASCRVFVKKNEKVKKENKIWEKDDTAMHNCDVYNTRIHKAWNLIWSLLTIFFLLLSYIQVK